jgi:hypothetical protein
MAGQIVNISNDEAISEVSLKCGDIYFKDFPKNIYSQAVYRAERSIAKEFKIMDRVWTYTNASGLSPIEVTPLNFNGAWRITITPANGPAIEYKEGQYDEVISNVNTSVYLYAPIFNANTRTIYYTNPLASDSVEIWYTSSIAGEEDYEETDADGNPNAIPVLPNIYFEEVIRRAVRYMAQLGIATFDQEKGNKYSRVLKIYTKRTDDIDEVGLQKDRAYIKIKPFQIY